MENMDVEEHHEEESSARVCASCRAPLSDYLHKNALVCDNCREGFIKFPIPIWVKAFGGAVLAVLVFSLVGISGNISTGVHFARAKVAYKKKAFATAQKELTLVIQKEPRFTEASCYLLVAAYHNNDYNTVVTVYEKIKNEKIDNDVLFNEISIALTSLSHLMASDTFTVFQENYGKPEDSIPVAVFANYVQTHEDDVYAKILIARRYSDENNYKASDSVADQILAKEAECYPALYLKIVAKRELGQMDSSEYYIRKVLKMNSENAYALSARVRNLLKIKKDNEALNLAKQLYKEFPNDAFVLATAIIAYHFNNDTKNRDLLLAEANKDSANADSYSYALDIISGKETFRN